MPIILKRGTESNRPSLFLRAGEPIFTTDNRRLYIGSGASDGGKELTFGQLTASLVSASKLTVGEITASKIIAVDFQAQITSMSLDHLEVTSTINATCSQALTSSYLLGSVSSASYATNAATASYLLGSIQSASYSDTASWYIGNQLGVGTQYPIDTFGIVGGMTLQGTGSRKLWWLNPDFTTSGLIQVLQYPDGQHAFECIMYDTASGVSTGRFVQNSRGFSQRGNGDLLSTDDGANTFYPWAGSSAVTSSGLLVQRQAKPARSTLLSVGGATTGSGYYTVAIASGTYSSIGPTLGGQFGSWQVQTYGGSTWSTSARMMMQTSGDHNEGSRPTDIIFQSTPSGSTTLQTRLKVNGSGVQVTGSLGVNGPITASAINVQTLVVTTISSSVEYVSGSTIHGSLSSNTHQFTGSVNVTGSTNLYGKYTSTVNGASNSSMVYSYGGRAAVGLYSANGTEASPSGWTNGSEMGKVLFYSYGSTGFGAASSQIATIADGDQSDANKGTLISIQGTSSGSNTLTEWARFRNGNLGIGTTAPASRLDLGSGVTGPRIYTYRDTAANSGFGTNLSGAGYENSIFAGGTSDSNGRISFGRRRVDTGTYTERMVVDVGSGNVSIGATATLGSATTHIKNTAAVSTSGQNTLVLSATMTQESVGSGPVLGFSDGTSIISRIRCFYSGGQGALSLRTYYLGERETLLLNPIGTIRLPNYGAGTLVTDSSGNVTATSDARAKDISGSFDRGLDAILNLSPKVYHWKEESGLNADDVNVGLIAQEVLPHIPEAVGYKDDKYTMSDRPIIAALINAVKELKADNDQLRARIEALEA